MITAPIDQRIEAVRMSLLVAGVIKEAMDTYYSNLTTTMQALSVEKAKLDGEQKGINTKKRTKKVESKPPANNTDVISIVKPSDAISSNNPSSQPITINSDVKQ